MNNKTKVIVGLLIGFSMAITFVIISRANSKNQMEKLHNELGNSTNKKDILQQIDIETKEDYLGDLMVMTNEAFIRNNPDKVDKVAEAIKIIEDSAKRDLDDTILMLYNEYTAMVEMNNKPFNDVGNLEIVPPSNLESKSSPPIPLPSIKPPQVDTNEITCSWEG